MAQRRLLRDFRTLFQDPPYGATGTPINNNVMHWKAVIFGPEDTVWEGGIFQLELQFPDDYPTRPPKVRFVNNVFHPNVYSDGRICLDILQGQWSPIYDVSAILTSIQSLLADPNPNSPANVEAARLYSDNRWEYNRRVTACVQESLDEDIDTILADAADAATIGVRGEALESPSAPASSEAPQT